MVHELHKAGYQFLRISAGMSPAGTHWRCHITPASNIAENGWEVVDWSAAVASYSTGDEDRYFGFKDAPGKSARELADMFLSRFPQLMEHAAGRDHEYAGWYVDMLGAAEHGRLPIFFADYELEPVPGEMPPPRRLPELQLHVGQINIIKNDDLRLEHVPVSTGRWEEIEPFCLTFDGYAENSIEQCAEIKHRVLNGRIAEASMDDLRITLFIIQRKIRWNDHMPVQKEDVDEMRPVIAEIRRRLEIQALNATMLKRLQEEYKNAPVDHPYQREVMARHEDATTRLLAEQARLLPAPPGTASSITGEAADFVWAFLMAKGEALETREVRNDVIKAISDVLERHRLSVR